jgi:hypothetical protein
MAISATVQWEVRPTGSDLNSGGFWPSGATDYSQSDTPVLSLTDVVTNGTTTVTSATGGFTSAMVGNTINIAGTIRQISTYTNTNTIVVDATVTTGSGQSARVGGALATPGKAAGFATAGNTIWLKSGTYLITSTTANISNGRVDVSVAANGSTQLNRFIGYGTTRGDGGTKPVIKASGIASVSLVTLSSSFSLIENVEVDGDSLSDIRGINLLSSAVQAYRCVARNCANSGIYGTNSNSEAVQCEVTGCTTQVAFRISRAFACYVHHNTVSGLSILDAGSASYCITNANTGASSDGVIFEGRGSAINCSSRNNGRDGIRLASHAVALNSLAYGNTGNGFGAASANAMALLLNCAGGSNTAGNVSSNLTRATIGSITLSANPFTTATIDALTSANTLEQAFAAFGINNTAGAGALLRAAGYPVSLDLGAVQHADSGGGGGTVVMSRNGFNGGLQ